MSPTCLLWFFGCPVAFLFPLFSPLIYYFRDSKYETHSPFKAFQQLSLWFYVGSAKALNTWVDEWEKKERKLCLKRSSLVNWHCCDRRKRHIWRPLKEAISFFSFLFFNWAGIKAVSLAGQINTKRRQQSHGGHSPGKTRCECDWLILDFVVLTCLSSAFIPHTDNIQHQHHSCTGITDNS